MGMINYVIRVRGVLDERWKDQFEGLELRHESGGITVLSGPLPDQPALHGILERIRDLNLTLVSVTEGEVLRPGGDAGRG